MRLVPCTPSWPSCTASERIWRECMHACVPLACERPLRQPIAQSSCLPAAMHSRLEAESGSITRRSASFPPSSFSKQTANPCNTAGGALSWRPQLLCEERPARPEIPASRRLDPNRYAHQARVGLLGEACEGFDCSSAEPDGDAGRPPHWHHAPHRGHGPGGPRRECGVSCSSHSASIVMSAGARWQISRRSSRVLASGVDRGSRGFTLPPPTPAIRLNRGCSPDRGQQVGEKGQRASLPVNAVSPVLAGLFAFYRLRLDAELEGPPTLDSACLLLACNS